MTDSIPAEYLADLGYVQGLSANRTLKSDNQVLQKLQKAARKGVKPLAAALAELNIIKV